jgi:hypothetical protein
MAITRLGLIGLPTTDAGVIPPKAAGGLPAYGTNIGIFDTWRPGYGGASVLVVRAGTTEHAPLYSDPGLTVPIPNPQVLLSYTGEDGIAYGKWRQAVYTYVPYFLTIDETAPTGVHRPPLYELVGQDASDMIATSDRGSRARTIKEIIDQLIFAEDFGTISDANGAEANTDTLEAAVGAASAQSGGEVILPAGSIVFTEINLPQGVVLRGQGRGVTTLRSTFGATAVTVSGDGAGLRNLTLDGVNNATGSIGLYGVGLASTVFDDVLVRRFDKGVVYRGLTAANWRDLTVSECIEGVDLRGDTDPTDSGNGGVIRGVRWEGGGVNLCTSAGLKVTFFDALTESITLAGVNIADNIGNGILLNGVRNFRMEGPSRVKAGELVTALRIQDDANLSQRDSNTTDHVTFDGVIFDGGALRFNGTCASVSFARCDFRGISFDCSVPDEPIILRDSVEDADTTVTGDTTKLMRAFVTDDLTVVGNTSDAVPTAAWSHTLEPGQIGFYQAEIVAQQQDGIKGAILWVAAGASRPGATLLFNLQTSNFTAGATLSGGTSGATARIMAVVQSAGSGTLTLGDISGTFISGEVLTDDDGGDARADGTISTSNAALDGGGNTDIRATAAINSSAYDAAFDVSGSKVRLMVTGANSEAVQWTCRIRRLDT